MENRFEEPESFENFKGLKIDGSVQLSLSLSNLAVDSLPSPSPPRSS